MNNNIPSDIIAKFQAKHDWLKQQYAWCVGEPIEPGIYRTLDGGWQCNYHDWCAIVIRPSENEPHEIHGAIGQRWFGEWGAFDISGKRGLLGHPISNEEIYDDDGDPNDRISHFENGDIIWTAKTDKTRIVNIKDRARWYEGRRNILVDILNKATSLKIPEKYAEELRQAARKCQEDTFEIALVGEFQGGKSTTFNALCDGRDLSPRGSGIKTSATIISAQNIAGDETKNGLSEWAEVTFKTPEAIALGLSTVFRIPLMDSEELRRLNSRLTDEEYEDAILTDDGFAGLIDLRNPECLSLLRSAANERWRKWEADKAGFKPDQLDQLRIATLLLRFFGSDGHIRIQERPILPIDQFQKLVAFPKDWEPRWRNGDKADFEFDEIAFLFVREVLVRLHSANLERLGCRITDCPGLFANAYDSSVAEKAIRHADAVWYLIEGDKQIGAEDQKCIRQIADWGLDGKIQATANIRGDWDEKSTTILDATESILSSMGMKFKVVPYNAKLAFLAMQGSLLRDHPKLFGDMDRSNMAADAKIKDRASVPDPSAMWPGLIKRIGYAMNVEELQEVSSLDADSVALARQSSHFNDILSRLETSFVPQKAKSILVDRGSDRAAKALVAYEGVLKASENAAEKTESEWKAKVEDARKQLADFVDRANGIVDRSVLGDGLEARANALAGTIIETTLGEKLVTDLSFHLAEGVTSAGLSLSKEQLAGKVLPYFTPKATNALKGALSHALEQWRSGDGMTQLRSSLDSVCNDIHDLWKERKIDAVEMLEGFSPPTVPEEDIVDLCDDLSKTLLGNAQVSNIIHGATNLRTFVLNNLRNVWEWLLRVLAELARIIVSDPSLPENVKLAQEQRRNEIIGDLASKFRSGIENTVNDIRFRDTIREPLEVQFHQGLEGIRDKLRLRLDALKADFENERVREPETQFGKSLEERRRIAGENKAIRTGVIEPLRKRIEAFAQAVSTEMLA